MLKKILWWCSGADIELLEKSTYNDKQRYSSIGATVVITSILSTFSAFYAFNTITDDKLSSVILGIMWGILITSLNRLVFTSIRISEKSIQSTILSLTPRLIIAVTIAFTLSYPFQLKLFETSINNKIYQDRQLQVSNVEKELKVKIESKNKEIAVLRDNYIKEIFGKGGSKIAGNGAFANALRRRIDIEENEISTLKVEYYKYRQSKIEFKIGLLERIEALNKLRSESSSTNITYISFLVLFLLLEVTPILMQVFFPKSLYDLLLEESEYLPVVKIQSKNTDNTTLENVTEKKSQFEHYCNKIISDLDFQINKNRLKATELLRTGIIIIISGILGYVGVAYLLVGVFFETHEFKPHYFYLMISLSLLFIFIQFLGGWFLKQYRRTLNTSLYLNAFKPNLDKYLLSYYAICEFSNEDDRKNLTKELLLILNNEFKNIDSQILNSQEENFAKEVTDSINSLKDTIVNLTSKLK